MSVNLDQIDELRKRANVSYETAKEALEKCNGDIVEALIYLEKQNKVKADKPSESLFDKIIKLIKKGNVTKFIIQKHENIIIKLPVTLVVIITIIAPYVVIPCIILALILGYRLHFQNENGEEMKVNDDIDKVSKAVDNAKAAIINDIK